MPGFKNIRAYVDAPLSGAEHFTAFRKVPSQATTAGNWCDLSMASGNPVPNYYAASPLEAATLDYEKGIWHGTACSPAQKHLRSITIMTSTANAVPSYWYLMDYLLYYPFIDMDAVGETQEMVNTVTLPRYTDGAGVRMMAVNVAPTVGGGESGRRGWSGNADALLLGGNEHRDADGDHAGGGWVHAVHIVAGRRYGREKCAVGDVHGRQWRADGSGAGASAAQH